MVWISGSANSTMPVTFGSDIPLLPWQRKIAIFNTKLATKICDFRHKIGYNSACAGHTPQMLAPTRRFSGSSNLMVLIKLFSDDQRRYVLNSRSNSLGSVQGSSNVTCPRPTPVTTVTKSWKFEYKINVIGLHDSPQPKHDYKTANINVKNLTV